MCYELCQVLNINQEKIPVPKKITKSGSEEAHK